MDDSFDVGEEEFRPAQKLIVHGGPLMGSQGSLRLPTRKRSPAASSMQSSRSVGELQRLGGEAAKFAGAYAQQCISEGAGAAINIGGLLKTQSGVGNSAGSGACSTTPGRPLLVEPIIWPLSSPAAGSSAAAAAAAAAAAVASQGEASGRSTGSRDNGTWQECQPLSLHRTGSGSLLSLDDLGEALSEAFGWIDRLKAPIDGACTGDQCSKSHITPRLLLDGHPIQRATGPIDPARRHDSRRQVTGTICRQVLYEDEAPAEDILALQDVGGRLFARRLRKDGLAEKAGVRPGDELVLIKVGDLPPFPPEGGARALLALLPPAVLLFMGFAGKFPAEVKLERNPCKMMFSSAEEVVGGSAFDICEQVVFRGDAALFLALQEKTSTKRLDADIVSRENLEDHGPPKGDIGADPADADESTDVSPTAIGRGDLKGIDNEDDTLDRECTTISESGSERLYELRQSEAKLMLQRALSELSLTEKRVYRNAFSSSGSTPSSPDKKPKEPNESKLQPAEPVQLRTPTPPRLATSEHSNSCTEESPVSSGPWAAQETQDLSPRELIASSPSVSSRLAGATKGTNPGRAQWGGAASASLGKKEPTAVSPRDLARSVPRRPLSPPRDMALSLPAGLSLPTGSIGTRPTTALRGASKGGRAAGSVSSSVTGSAFASRSTSVLAARGASGGSGLSAGPRMALSRGFSETMLGVQSTATPPMPAGGSARGTSPGHQSTSAAVYVRSPGLVQPRHIPADAAEWGDVE